MSMLLYCSISVSVTDEVMVFCTIGESKVSGAHQVTKHVFDGFPMSHAMIVKKVR